MPDDKPTAEDIATEKPAASDGGVKVTLQRLLDDSGAILGVDRHVVAGAFEGVAADKEVSVDAAKKRIAQWHKAPVKTDAAAESTSDQSEEA